MMRYIQRQCTTTADRQHNDDDQNFHLVWHVHAKAYMTSTVTFSGGSLQTRIEIDNAQDPVVSSASSSSSSSSSSPLEETRAAKRPKIVPRDNVLCEDLLDENPGASKDLPNHQAAQREHQDSGTGRNPSPVEGQETDTNLEASVPELDVRKSPSQGKLS
jgi:hypothetical protein